jgi:protein-tyrosine kinase
MSRIDEALRQAGLKPQGESRVEPTSEALESFPAGPDGPAEVVEPQAYRKAVERVDAPKIEASAVEAREVKPSLPARPTPQSMKAARDARSLAAEKLVVHEKTGPGCVEQYRRIAAMLHQLQEERGTKVVMVASAEPGEGKTLTAANLALTLSESYHRRVLLIDADLRRPSLNMLFRLHPSATGLSEGLRGDVRGPLKVLQLSDYLALLPGGKPDRDPMAGLTSGRMQQIIEQGSADYDWVILDTPPVGLQSDAHLLAAMVEATILVIGAGRTQVSAIQHAIDTIGREKIVGVVLNRVDQSAMSEAGYYAYYSAQALPGSKGVELSKAAG